jgi:hypothetical membrane protein
LGVGIFPENTFIVSGIPVLHSISALLAFVVGAACAIASVKITSPPFKQLSLVLGVFALGAFAVFLAADNSGVYGLGAGALERLTAYPTVLWMIGFGSYLLGNSSEKKV